MHYFGIFCILKIGIIREVLAFKNSYLLVILFIVPSFLIVLHMILKDSIYINKRFGIFRCAYIILFMIIYMIIYIYENDKLHICELEIISCVSVIILTVLGRTRYRRIFCANFYIYKWVTVYSLK